ncbi:uncharacterized protein LOC128396852 isoform X2 [Panonychus citri]|uniref:uncharacterized protein LOC128396852 isoform X2 n=1 Tax=Panonychus citri TaxID=50023 RepID=UPI002306E395|nr:uncharacterized protein LOC128396852 isoform X2 [Panonychus citri]
MEQQSSSFLPDDSINYQCFGCSKEIKFSDVESDDEDLPNHLLDHFLDKSRSAKRQVITDRPCYHGRLDTPLVGFNVAALPLSNDLFVAIEHIPKTLVFTEKCTPDDFFNLLGCTKESTEFQTNIIVFKLIPEDIEDENPTERLYQHLIEKKNFTQTKLRCEIYKELYILPLPKENEPPAFLPITNRLNLEKCPREDNLLLGVLVKKPPLEEGEISGEKISSSFSPDLIDSVNSNNIKSPSPSNRGTSPATLEKIKSGLETTFKLMPANRYGSYIGASTEDIPFLTDPVTNQQSIKKQKPQLIQSISQLTDDISSDSNEGEPEKSANTKSTSRKRTLPEVDQNASKQSSKQNVLKKQQRASSLTSPSPSPSPSRSSSSSSSKVIKQKSLSSSSLTKTTTNQLKPISNNPASAKLSPKKLKMSASNVVDLDSSESDPDADLFPRKPNNSMTGIFITTFGDFEFKYHVIRSDRPEVKKYLPLTLKFTGRVNTVECEQCLNVAKHKPNIKIIIFQILPRETSEDKRIFGNFATYLINRDRYAICDYKPEAYRAYVLPVVKGTANMKAFEILKLKPRGKYPHELYGLVIKKSAMVTVLPLNPQVKIQSLPSTSSTGSSSATRVQATSSTFTCKEKSAAESSEFHNTNLKAIYGSENFPELDVNRLANLIHSSVDDLLSLSANVANLLQKTTENDADPQRKEEATLECQSKVLFIMGLEEQQHAKRKKAYETILSWLKTLTS